MTSTRNALSPDSGQPWGDRGAWSVGNGIWRIPLPLPGDGLVAVNVYALETEAGLTLIDGGWAVEQSRSQLEWSLALIGYSLRDIRHFLVTHIHRDHYTQATAVRRVVGSHVSLGSGERESLELAISPPEPGADDRARLLREAGAPDLARAWIELRASQASDPGVWEYPDTWLRGDELVRVGGRQLQAVHTPGHTQGHLVFIEPDAGLLFAGDHVLPTITPSIGYEPKQAANPLGTYLASLTKVRALPDAQLLPAHGPVAPSVHARVDRLLAHHRSRLDACIESLGRLARTSAQVARDLPWTSRNRRLAELDVHNQALAVLETRAHLEVLTATGKAELGQDEDGIRWYRARDEGRGTAEPA